MSILDDDDPPSSARESPARDLVKEAEVLTDPMKVILDIRKDIEKSADTRWRMTSAGKSINIYWMVNSGQQHY